MQPRPDPTPPPTSSSRGPVLASIITVLLVTAAFFGWREWVRRSVVPAPPAPVVEQPRVEPDAGPALSLEDGDALVKQLATGWSADALFRSWLDGPVVRFLTAAAQLVAEGQSPHPALPFLQLVGAYEVREVEAAKPRGKQPRPPPKLYVSPASWTRYDGLTRAFTSVDAAAAGDAWGTLRPYFDTAHAETGRPGTRFDDVLAQAVRRLLAVKFPEGDVELVPKGLLYAYADPALEALSPAEKHLLRLGPVNGRSIQASLRTFAEHAGLDLGER